MAKAVRLADIGKKLNVSTVTVSKALSGQKGVSEELRAKIIRLADEMGYQKSESRQNTNEGKSFTLGVIVADRYVSENQQRSGETKRTSQGDPGEKGRRTDHNGRI